MLFTLIMEGTAASPLTPQVTPAWLAKCAAAVEVQLNRDVAAEWGGAYSVRPGSKTDVAKGGIAFGLVDALTAAPGDVAYHDVDGNAVPFALLALQTCSTLDDVSIGVSHECCETAGDPACNTWSDNGGGLEYAQELCDSVEALSYAIDGIHISDFVTRAFFAPQSRGAYHYLASVGEADLAGPYATAPNGYQLQRPSGGQVVQVTGSMRAMRATHAKHFSSRTYRRGARLGETGPTLAPAPKLLLTLAEAQRALAAGWPI
jgi:hypothetical protein